MVDLYEDPAGVRSFAEKICHQLLELLAAVNSMIPHPADGTCHRWLNYWVPGSGFWFSEDDAIMLSPETYGDFFLDLDTKLCDSCDYPVVHWHTGAMHLIDELLNIDNLKMIQLSFDPNGPDFSAVVAVCQRIEQAGKKICFQMGLDETKITEIIRCIDYGSCMFYFGGISDIEDANNAVALIEHLRRR